MADLHDRYVAKARDLVVENFPEMDGARPSISKKTCQGKGLAHTRQSLSSSTSLSARDQDESVEPRVSSSGQTTRYIVTFQRDVPLPGGRKMKRLVRVTMDEAGEILRLASSK